MTTADADISSVYHAPRAPGLRAVLFDLDDTLFDHEESAIAALSVVRERYECFARIPPDDFARAHATLLEALHPRVVSGELAMDDARTERFHRLFADAGESLARELSGEAARCYRAAYMAARRPIQGAAALLEALHARVRIAVVSNNLLEEQQQKLRECRLSDHVDVLVVSEETGVAKPDPEIFGIALRRVGCAAAEALMVGDSWANDIAGAAAAGVPALWFNRRGAPSPDPAAGVPELRSFEPVDAALHAILTSHPSGRAHRH